jgi:hypothetical protein
MTMMDQVLDFSEAHRSDFGFRPLVARHRMHLLDLFQDQQLIALLDGYPRARLQAFTMGRDRCRRDDWQYVDATNASGSEIFAAVVRGRLWLNLLRVDLADRQYAELLDRLRHELSERCPRLGLASINFGTLLISSPHAMVYYHFDASHQALWHMRGAKRIWLYPACDERFAPRQIMEDIFSGTYNYDEEIPYSPDFDRDAMVFDLQPGDVASWPHNAPHRVENLDTLNVSLSTGFLTEAAERRSSIYGANRLLRRKLGLPVRSTQETGLAATVKILGYRAVRKTGILRQTQRRPYVSALKIDPEAPLGYSRQAG